MKCHCDSDRDADLKRNGEGEMDEDCILSMVGLAVVSPSVFHMPSKYGTKWISSVYDK